MISGTFVVPVYDKTEINGLTLQQPFFDHVRLPDDPYGSVRGR